MVYKVKRGDTTPPITATLEDENGPAPLLGASIRYLARQHQGVKVIDGVAAAIDENDPDARPNVQYVWAADGSDTDTPGTYDMEWEVTFANGRRETFPNEGHDTLIIEGDLGGTG